MMRATTAKTASLIRFSIFKITSNLYLLLFKHGNAPIFVNFVFKIKYEAIIICGNMMEEAYRLFFKSFSNRTRFEIIQLLRKRPMNVTEICDATGFEQSRVSHNLKCLEKCGFVSCKRDGKKRIYSLDGKYITPILDDIDKYIERYGKGLKICGLLNEKK